MDNHSQIFFRRTVFRGIGTEDAIKKALSRLVKDSQLERLAHGIYFIPKNHPTSRFLAFVSAKINLCGRQGQALRVWTRKSPHLRFASGSIFKPQSLASPGPRSFFFASIKSQKGTHAKPRHIQPLKMELCHSIYC